MMEHSAMSPEAIQPEDWVAPGDETGLYYIPVAGLPWQSSWQDVKDFTRLGNHPGDYINVDCVMVYPGTTNGWWNYPLQNQYGHYAPLSLSLPLHASSPQNPTLYVPVTQAPSFPAMGTCPTPPPTPYALMSPQIMVVPFQQWNQAPVIQTEARKIMIKKLPHLVNERTLKGFLQQFLNLECGPIHEIIIARDSKNEPRGHAFVTFHSYAAAKTAIDMLDGYQYWGHDLQAKFAKEGVAPSRRNSHPRQSFISSQSMPTIAPMEAPYFYAPSNSSRETTVSPTQSVAQMSNASKSADIGNSSPTPVVVDGSSGRRSV
ncbi:hypothetical protein G7Y89_g11013 [Cudoniella acicularis]|uniref:RRM domain-containing protein n=1 Tax=Cudoniella acicularis TaxID=354080 RepID=A0A8H4REB9_9HELO|nr:hypothetical protein G7Y89_g11013 [Cudoniella acicularis]